ncbi:group 3 secretory phospholipase A2 [Pelodiscus sinensis]|uniref:group 3 secretory phospholipase A2 n=1 Tax=Pelodiscus sinensis TaxID=13735 RepID=UPI003F6B174B
MRRLLCALFALALPGASAAFRGGATFCHLETPGSRYLSFLARRSGGLALVQSAWDAQGHLLACAIHHDARLTRRYRASCAKRSGLSRSPARRRALATLARRMGTCRGAGGLRERRAPREELGRRRTRRGWTMPGTLWCGVGDSAGNLTELGLFQGPDLCCREHDQCAEQLAPLEFRYGVRNLRLHTVSHCRCDARFRRCLRRLNDPIADLVGAAFFEALELPCFILEPGKACVEWHWWGGCKRYGSIALARMVQQSRYSPRGAGLPPGKPTRRKNRKRPGQGSVAQWSQSPGDQGPGTPPPGRGLGTLPPAPAEGEASTPRRPVGREPPLPTTRAPERGRTDAPRLPELSHWARSCGGYRRLDRCPHKIGPQEVRYQLQNPDSRVLFHCNCTRGLARALRRAPGPNAVAEELLAGAVSPACFVLEPPPGCAAGEDQQPNCIGEGRAVLVPTRHLPNTLRARWTRPGPQATWQAGGAPLGLYAQCLQLARTVH